MIDGDGLVRAADATDAAEEVRPADPRPADATDAAEEVRPANPRPGDPRPIIGAGWG